LTAEARATLQRNADWLKAHPDQSVTLEGHCDERGTNEYNFALGQRRAQSVFQYLIGLGVSKDRLSTVTYGEEQPLVDASNESAWAQNRRVEFTLSEAPELVD
jgi:peptidoglycan-associated lipoprotein